MNQSVSIVIPTYKRKKHLSCLFKSLNYEKGVFQELIIVEQVEDNRTYLINKAKKYGLVLRYFFLKKSSTARAMNVGVSVAKGKYILFLDDDITIKKGFIGHHLNNFRDVNVVATVGRTLTDGQPVESKRKDTGRINLLGGFSDGFSSAIHQEVDTVIGCNTCWRKDIYEKLHGIDEQFTGNAIRLESDLSLRAKKLGYKIVFVPEGLVYHHRAETGGARKSDGRLIWYFDFFSNEVYFFLKHRHKILLPVLLITKSNWILRCMFGFGREVSLRSVVTPFKGIINGIKKHRSLINTYDYWR